MGDILFLRMVYLGKGIRLPFSPVVNRFRSANQRGSRRRRRRRQARRRRRRRRRRRKTNAEEGGGRKGGGYKWCPHSTVLTSIFFLFCLHNSAALHRSAQPDGQAQREEGLHRHSGVQCHGLPKAQDPLAERSEQRNFLEMSLPSLLRDDGFSELANAGKGGGPEGIGVVNEGKSRNEGGDDICIKRKKRRKKGGRLKRLKGSHSTLQIKVKPIPLSHSRSSPSTLTLKRKWDKLKGERGRRTRTTSGRAPSPKGYVMLSTPFPRRNKVLPRQFMASPHAATVYQKSPLPSYPRTHRRQSAPRAGPALHCKKSFLYKVALFFLHRPTTMKSAAGGEYR